MDANRFDTLSRQLAQPATRRATLGGFVAGGLLGALGLNRAALEARAAQGDSCVLAFVATVRMGPSVDQVMLPTGTRSGELRGELSFSLSETGTLESGVLRLPDGDTLPVVGQATGHALQMRIELAPRVALVAVGVGEREVADCRGAIDGVVTGPDVGDLGDWHAAVLGQSDATGASDATERAGSRVNRASNQTTAGQSPAGSTPMPTSGGPRGATGTTGSTGPSAGLTLCASGLSRCGDVCVDLQSDSDHCGACGDVCESGLVPVACRDGICDRDGCPPGQTYCGAADGCRDLASDLSHCGRCQLHCAGGLCVGGVCGPAGLTCPAGQVDCGNGCVDLSSNSSRCGACGNACADGQVCQDGACSGGSPQCADGLTNCGGVCVDLGSDNANCGVCGDQCEEEQFCQDGFCAGDPLCPGPEANCGGTCADLQRDPAHCGACLNACTAGQDCQGGACTSVAPVCASEQTTCGGVCVDLQTDATHCGFCGNACSPGASCTGGGCTDDFPCTGGKKLCADACVDTSSDPANCGACGNNCGGSACVSGICSGIIAQLDCAALGLTNCGGICVDFNNDPANCGACGYDCGVDNCNFGICVGVVEQPGAFVLTCADSGLTDCGGVCVDLISDNNNCGACGHACFPGLCNNGNGTCSVCDPNNEPVTYTNCA